MSQEQPTDLRISRRGLMRLGGGLAAAGTSAGCDPEADDPNPQVAGRVWTTPEETVAGTICRHCDGGCGLRLRIRDGRDIVGLAGLPMHPVNRGGLCPRAYGLLALYASPSRLTTPLMRADKQAPLHMVGWDRALGRLTDVVQHLQSAGRGREILILGPRFRGLRGPLLRRFADALGGGQVLAFPQASAVPPVADFSRAGVILSVGAELFEDWLSPTNAMRAFRAFRGGGERVPGRLIHIGARWSRTAAMADLYVPVRPGLEGRLAAGIADLLAQPPAPAAPDRARLAAAVGVSDRTLEAVLHALDTAGPVLVVGPWDPGGVLAPPEAAAAVRRLNAWFGAGLDRPLSGRHDPSLDSIVPELAEPTAMESADRAEDPVAALVRRLTGGPGGPVSLVILIESEPLTAHPHGAALAAALRSVPLVVSTAAFARDAAGYADLVLPDALPPERWIDDPVTFLPDRLAVSLMPPAVSTAGDSGPRDAMDGLLAVAHGLGGAVAEAVPWRSYESFLQEAYGDLHASIESGVWTTSAPISTPEESPVPQQGSAPATREASEDGAAFAFPLRLLLFRPGAEPVMGAARQPQLQEHRAGPVGAPYVRWLTVHPETARTYGLAEGQRVRLRSAHGVLTGVLRLFQATQPDVVEVPVLADRPESAFTLIGAGIGAGSGVEPVAARRVRIEAA